MPEKRKDNKGRILKTGKSLENIVKKRNIPGSWLHRVSSAG